MTRAPSTPRPAGPPSEQGGGATILHGGDLDAARAEFPDAPLPWVDLSTGINPVPYPLPPLAADVWTRLPGRGDLADLEATAARAYGTVAGVAVVAAPGTQALIQLLPRLRPAGRVAVLGPTYAEHAHGWRAAGHAVETVTATDALAAADVAVIVNPNNPDGRLLPVADLLALARRLAARNGLLVVDEAFADVAADTASVVPALAEAAAPIVVLRSFGKMYGLAGVRLGFALTADAALAAALRGRLGPWAVPGPAIAIGRQALADAGWRAAARARLARDAARLDALLVRAGLAVVGGTALFRLAASDEAPALFARLGEQGILVRRFAEDTRRLRFGLPGDVAGWARLEGALALRPTADRSAGA